MGEIRALLGANTVTQCCRPGATYMLQNIFNNLVYTCTE